MNIAAEWFANTDSLKLTGVFYKHFLKCHLFLLIAFEFTLSNHLTFHVSPNQPQFNFMLPNNPMYLTQIINLEFGFCKHS